MPAIKRNKLMVFLFQVTDGVSSAITEVRVTIEDVNDCDPMFMESSYSFSFLENLPAGTSVGSIRATDCDAGSNAQIQYSISSGSISVFELNCECAMHVYWYCWSQDLLLSPQLYPASSRL